MRISTASALAAGFLLLFGGALLGAFVIEDRDLARTMTQGLLNVIIAVAGFYFGSSQGSQRKDEAISRALRDRSDG